MQLLNIYTLWTSGDLTDDDVAKALGITVRSWKIRVGKNGHDLPKMLGVLDKIRANAISRGEASEALGIQPRTLNALMKNWGVTRPITDGVVKRAAAKVKWEVRKKFAIDYISGEEPLETNAERAKVSVRQLRRWVSDLLRKHYDMAFKDLKNISSLNRKKLAKDIEEAEGLELAKQQMMRAVFVGQKSVSEEAYERLVDKKAKKLRKRNV